MVITTGLGWLSTTFLLVLLIVLAGILEVILLLCFLDVIKKRKVHSLPFLSFIMPCHNNKDSIRATIDAVYKSYDMNCFEFIIIDDKSEDGSLNMLKELQKKYHFMLLENRKNSGKPYAINKAAKRAKADILFLIDADTIITQHVVHDILARLEEKNVAAVSSPYTPKGKGFFPSMQAIEYTMQAWGQGSHNAVSLLNIWGGAVAVKKKEFHEVGGLSEHALNDDVILAFKLNKKGYKVKQSFSAVKSEVPATVHSWFKQKMRWAMGGVQNQVLSFSTWLRNPLWVLFLTLFSVLSVVFTLLLLLTLIQLSSLRNPSLLWEVFLILSFALFAVPFTLSSIKDLSQWYKVFLAVPFTFLYMPLFVITSIIGMIKGILLVDTLKTGRRTW